MIVPNFLQTFILKQSNMYKIFHEIATEMKHPNETADQLIRILPKQLREAPVWLDRLTKLWRYNFGLPYNNMPGGQLVLVTDQFPQVSNLYRSMYAANSRLDPQQLLTWLKRLNDPAKHLDVLAEMRPIINIETSINTRFEIEGRGEGTKTIDWIVEPIGERPLLFDVKNRITDLLDHLKQIMPAMQTGRDPKIVDSPDPFLLFRSTIDKFKTVDRSVQLQGVWIHSGIMQDRTRLITFFQGLDASRFHFAVLGNWDNDATILARHNEDILYIERIFGIVNSDRFLTDNYRKSQ